LGKSLSSLYGVIKISSKMKRKGENNREETHKKVPLSSISHTLNRWDSLWEEEERFFLCSASDKKTQRAHHEEEEEEERSGRHTDDDALKTGDNNNTNRRRRRRKRRRWQTPPARVKEKRTIAEAPMRRCVEGILFFFSHSSSFALNVCPYWANVLPLL
jgi:hypothetical protein